MNPFAPQGQMPPQGMGGIQQPQRPQMNPQMMAIMQKLQQQNQLNKPGYTKGIPTEIFNVLEPTEQKAVEGANPQLMIEMNKDLMGDDAFLEASKRGNMPKVTNIVRQYLELYRLTGLETNKVTGESISE